MTADPIRSLRDSAVRLDTPADLDAVLRHVGNARHVLIGEATHGTAEFYRRRAELTRRLITELGFSFVAVEGDWSDCHRLHCSVSGAPGAAEDPTAVLWGFQRWPRWMWANEEVEEFAQWLRGVNARSIGTPVGFHGLDVYGLWQSLEEVVRYVREHHPGEVDAAIEAYRCFEPYRDDPNGYAVATRMLSEDCQDEVARLLADLAGRVHAEPSPGLDAAFVARQHAEVVAGAERYYRALFRADHESWNVRDRHMADTLDRLTDAYGPDARGVVWAHNTHVGDARATDMADSGVINLGQVLRERHGLDAVFAVGFGTYWGSVIASDFWGGPVRSMDVPPARAGSVEALMHDAVGDGDTLFVLDDERGSGWAHQERPHRAIGVVYRSAVEHRGNYVPTVLARRYDAFVHCDRTTSVMPLHDVATVRGAVELAEQVREGGS